MARGRGLWEALCPPRIPKRRTADSVANENVRDGCTVPVFRTAPAFLRGNYLKLVGGRFCDTKAIKFEKPRVGVLWVRRFDVWEHSIRTQQAQGEGATCLVVAPYVPGAIYLRLWGAYHFSSLSLSLSL